MKYFLTTIILLLFISNSFSQILHPVHWSYAFKKITKTERLVFIKATIDNGWHIYSTNQQEGGPLKTTFIFTPSNSYSLIGQIKEPKPFTHFEDAFGINVSYFETSVTFQQKIALKSSNVNVYCKVNFMSCNDEKCLPPDEVEFSISVK